MGSVKPYLFAYCDNDYYEKYGRALENSARAQGHECDAICSGETVTDEASKIRHSHWRYHLLPQILLKRGPTLMLDADCIVRKTIELSDSIEIGLRVQDMDDYQRKVNGGCVYITPAAMSLAFKLKERMKFQHWFDDQICLFRYGVKRSTYKTKIFDDSFFSWKCNPDASIWTGKGKAKFRENFQKENNRWLTSIP